MKHEHRIKEIEAGSIADELGLEPGDRLLAINDNEIEDVFDYHYYVNDEENCPYWNDFESNDDSFLPRTYAEIEYDDLDTPEAMAGCHFDDMNYLRYRER